MSEAQQESELRNQVPVSLFPSLYPHLTKVLKSARSVVQITTEAGRVACGVVVGPTHVLTAGHVVFQDLGMSVSCPSEMRVRKYVSDSDVGPQTVSISSRLFGSSLFSPPVNSRQSSHIRIEDVASALAFSLRDSEDLLEDQRKGFTVICGEYSENADFALVQLTRRLSKPAVCPFPPTGLNFVEPYFFCHFPSDGSEVCVSEAKIVSVDKVTNMIHFVAPTESATSGGGLFDAGGRLMGVHDSRSTFEEVQGSRPVPDGDEQKSMSATSVWHIRAKLLNSGVEKACHECLQELLL